jgi:hypothetical protein
MARRTGSFSFYDRSSSHSPALHYGCPSEHRKQEFRKKTTDVDGENTSNGSVVAIPFNRESIKEACLHELNSLGLCHQGQKIPGIL